MKLTVKKGLDIPMAGKPFGSPQLLALPKKLSLNLDPFYDIRFKLLAKVGDLVKIGQPLVESKTFPGQMFVSPASGVVSEVRRGLKRRLLDIVIERDEKEQYEEQKGISLSSASREDLLSFFMKAGVFPYMRTRPFDLVAAPKYVPRDIFVRAIETLPLAPPEEMHVQGHDEIFQIGLDTLVKLTDGKVHLVYDEKTECSAFKNAQNVVQHTVSGPHPAGTSSVHVHFISPIKHAQDFVWVLSTVGVLTIGHLIKTGRYFTDRVISIAGDGILEERRGFFKTKAGYPIANLIENRIGHLPVRLISGDPLCGRASEIHDYLGFYHNVMSAIPESLGREAFHFLRLGLNKYSATKAYLSGHIKPPHEGYYFDTNQHGEERAFIDAEVYEKVMPMRIPTMHLIKAILSSDFELAEKLGLLEVEPHDFALATFICPSKIEMIDLVKEGIHRYSKEMGH